MDEHEKRALILRCGKLLASAMWIDLMHEREVVAYLMFEIHGVRAPMSFIGQNYERILAEAKMIRSTLKEATT